MKVAIHGRTKKILIITSLFVVAVLATFLLSTLLSRPPEDIDVDDDSDDSIIIDDIEPNSDDQVQPDNISVDDSICIGNDINVDRFTLISVARVYTTALEAKNKTNPSLTYQPAQYYVFKCFDGMANITRTQGVPGGWINPDDPYDDSVTSGDTSGDTIIDVMDIDNTIVNWSHEYPAAFAGEYNGFWNISPDNLYLTFDCGYDYNSLAASIMDTLSAKNVKAVFFVTGDFMEDRPDLVQRMVSEGHVVGNHSYDHLNQPQNLVVSTDVVVADIRAWEEKYRAITGSNPSTFYFRPPAGAISRRSLALMDQLGYKTLMWGAAYKDWDTSAQPTQESAMELLRQYTTPGDIILLHGVSETSANILGQYIDEYRGDGLEFLLP